MIKMNRIEKTQISSEALLHKVANKTMIIIGFCGGFKVQWLVWSICVSSLCFFEEMIKKSILCHFTETSPQPTLDGHILFVPLTVAKEKLTNADITGTPAMIPL